MSGLCSERLKSWKETKGESPGRVRGKTLGEGVCPQLSGVRLQASHKLLDSYTCSHSLP